MPLGRTVAVWYLFSIRKYDLSRLLALSGLHQHRHILGLLSVILHAHCSVLQEEQEGKSQSHKPLTHSSRVTQHARKGSEVAVRENRPQHAFDRTHARTLTRQHICYRQFMVLNDLKGKGIHNDGDIKVIFLHEGQKNNDDCWKIVPHFTKQRSCTLGYLSQRKKDRPLQKSPHFPLSKKPTGRCVIQRLFFLKRVFAFYAKIYLMSCYYISF